MKKWSVLAVVAMAAVMLTPLAEASPQLAAGGKVGINIGWFTGDEWKEILDEDGWDNKARVGLAATGFLEIGITDQFAVQPEIGITSRRGGGGITSGGTDFDLIAKFTVVDVAILAKPRLEVGDGVIYGLIGPQLFFVVGDFELEFKGGGFSGSQKIDPDNRVLFGLAVGAGYSHPVGPGSIVGDLVYTRAFNSPADGGDIFLNGISLKAGYQIPF